MAPLPDLLVHPTRTIPQLVSKVLPRQASTTTIVATNPSGGATLDGGAIAGIVIGSIVGFLFILWLLRSCTNLGNPGAWGTTFGSREKLPANSYETTYPRQHYHQHRRSGSRHSHHSHHSHGGRSPRRSSTSRPVYVERQAASPRAPPKVYYARESRDSARSGRGRRQYYG